MPSDLDNLKARRTAIATELAAMGRKPSYSTDSRSVQWTEYRKSLLEEFKELNDLIIMLEPGEFFIQATP